MLIFPKNYYNAIPYVPIILAAVVIQALYCLDYFFHFHENSIYILWFTVFAMLFNLGFNLLLIPGNVQHGALIASWTTLIAFLLRAAIEMVVIKKKYKVEFDVSKEELTKLEKVFGDRLKVSEPKLDKDLYKQEVGIQKQQHYSVTVK